MATAPVYAPRRQQSEGCSAHIQPPMDLFLCGTLLVMDGFVTHLQVALTYQTMNGQASLRHRQPISPMASSLLVWYMKVSCETHQPVFCQSFCPGCSLPAHVPRTGYTWTGATVSPRPFCPSRCGRRFHLLAFLRVLTRTCRDPNLQDRSRRENVMQSI